MATTEAAPASLGPHYAPEDPTLPKPWKGLIDGSTGLLYYWNPETNVTQYERPAASAPPLPPGPPPGTSTPKLAPIPVARTLLPNSIMTQHPGQQMPQQQGQQLPQQSGQQMQQQQPSQQVPLQQTQQMPYPQTPQMPSQQASQQQAQQYPQMQMQQMPYPQASYLQGQIMLRPQGQQMQGPQAPYQQRLQPQAPQVPYQQLQQLHGPNIAHQHGQQPQESQIMHSQGQLSPGLQIMHQQGQQTQGPQSAQQQGQHPQGQQNADQQGQQSGFPRMEESGRQEGRQSGFSLPLVQQTGVSSSGHHHLQSAAPQVQISPVGAPSGQPQEHLGKQQTGAPSIQLQQAGTDTSYRQRQMGSPIVNNQMGNSMVHSPMGLKMGYKENHHERSGNEFNSSSRTEGPVMLPQQPKLAALPPDMRMGPINHQFIAPGQSGGLNMASGHAMPNMYNRATFPNASPMSPSPRMSGQPDYTHISSADAYRQHHEVTAMGDNVPAPFMTFETTGFPPEILREMHLAGFSSPTPIQAQTWPVALESRDIVAIAKTGSGKTLGYLIPAFIHLRRCRNNPQFGPTVLVLAPTRELATQIQDEAIKFGRSSRVSCTCLYGGAPKGPQLKEIERGADIIVATPGRLNDILEMKKINFRQVSFLVLDEADRMLDMGFEPQIRKIVNEIPPRRQTLMYTATWPKEVRKIAGDLLVNPVQVNIGSVDELAANKSITQYVEVVPPMDKQRRLEQILRAQERGSKIIIFCSTKRLCDQLARSIGRTFGAAAIHGDKSQGERDHVLNQFRSGKAPILVATDVAARGLDIKDIRVVVNYDFPTGIEDYVHRIGRTGRAGATGVSYTFFCDQDWKYAADLVKLLEGANQKVPPEVREMAARGGPMFARPRGGMSRLDSGGGRWDSGGGRGTRDGGGGFGGTRDGGGGFGGRGGRNDLYGGRGGRGREFGGPRGWGRHDRGPHDRYNNLDGRGRYDNRRRTGDRNRDQSYSRSPERVRTWGYDRSRSESRSRSRSRSWSRSRSRSRSRSHSRSYDRFDRSHGRNFSHPPAAASNFSRPLAASNFSHPTAAAEAAPPGHEAVAESGFDAPLPGKMLPGPDNDSLPRNELANQLPGSDAGRLGLPDLGTIPEPGQHQAPNL